MKEFLSIVVDDNLNVSVSSEYFFSGYVKPELRFDRNDPLYNHLVEAFRHCSPDCLEAIRVLESARKESRYSYQCLHPELEKALKEWRKQKARAKNLPVYLILRQKVLLDIADNAPATEDELLAIPGFGPGLFASYGKEILTLTKDN